MALWENPEFPPLSLREPIHKYFWGLLKYHPDRVKPATVVAIPHLKTLVGASSQRARYKSCSLRGAIEGFRVYEC